MSSPVQICIEQRLSRSERFRTRVLGCVRASRYRCRPRPAGRCRLRPHARLIFLGMLRTYVASSHAPTWVPTVARPQHGFRIPGADRFASRLVTITSGEGHADHAPACGRRWWLLGSGCSVVIRWWLLRDRSALADSPFRSPTIINLQRRVCARVRPVELVNCGAIQASASERQIHRQVTRSARPPAARSVVAARWWLLGSLGAAGERHQLRDQPAADRSRAGRGAEAGAAAR
jgi:hypothetical protein